MRELILNREKCISCGNCATACPFGAMEMKEGVPGPNEACTLCGCCVRVCKAGALCILDPEKEKNTAGVSFMAENRSQRAEGTQAAAGNAGREGYDGVWVFIQETKEGILPVSFELLGKAEELAQEKKTGVTALYATGYLQTSENRVSALYGAGADRVILWEDIKLKDQSLNCFTEWVVRLCEEKKPEILLFPATLFGRTLAPSVAAALKTGLTADCTGLEIQKETGNLIQKRPAFGGNLMASILCPDARPQMATVRPGVFKGKTEIAAKPKAEQETCSVKAPKDLKPEPGRCGLEYPEDLKPAEAAKPEPERCGLEVLPELKTAVLEKFREKQGGSIGDADIIIDVGRGIGAKKKLPLYRRLAELLGGALGCTRPLVEEGWLTYKEQIGQTGSAVSPKLLICFGVSGAIQHRAGIGGAKHVIAVNSDPSAPIFKAAEYGICADCEATVKEWIEYLENRG